VRVLDEEKAPAHIADVLKSARRRVKDWKIQHNGWKTLADGLKSTYARGRKAFAVASVEPTVENLHEWRKRVKDLWHQLQVVRPMEPQALEREAKQAHELADILGEEHDLAVLSQFLTEAPAKFGKPSAVATLLALVVRRRAELQQAANVLGRKVHREKPRAFFARLHGYWDAWRAAAHAMEAG
jgi:CHAD domain-containing protein